MFDKILDKLEKNGWKEDCPSKGIWTFRKGRFVCKLFWYYGTVQIYRIVP